ncbi:hypothetical protein ACFVUN_06305 [Kitasatospora griseola]|uniref:hypothetical protein n=1 Tax=Kitasatospora griseola TaxID=2064 RepID=UPI0036DE844E
MPQKQKKTRRKASPLHKRPSANRTSEPLLPYTPEVNTEGAVLAAAVRDLLEEREARHAPVKPPPPSKASLAFDLVSPHFSSLTAQLAAYLPSAPPSGAPPTNTSLLDPPKPRVKRGVGDVPGALIDLFPAAQDPDKSAALEAAKNNNPWIGSAPFAVSEKWSSGDSVGALWELAKAGTSKVSPAAGRGLWTADYVGKAILNRLNRKLAPHAKARAANAEFAKKLDGLTGVAKEVLRQNAWYQFHEFGDRGREDPAFQRKLNRIAARYTRRIKNWQDTHQKAVGDELKQDRKTSRTAFKEESDKTSKDAIESVTKYRDDLLAGRVDEIKDTRLKPAADFPAPSTPGRFTYADMDSQGTIAYDYQSGRVLRYSIETASWSHLTDLTDYVQTFGASKGAETHVQGIYPEPGTLNFILLLTEPRRSYYVNLRVTLTGKPYKAGAAQKTFNVDRWQKITGRTSEWEAKYAYKPADNSTILFYGDYYTSLNTTTSRATLNAGTPPLLAGVKKSLKEQLGSTWEIIEMTGGPHVLRMVITNGRRTKHAEYSVRRKFFIPVRDVAEKTPLAPEVCGVDYVDVEFPGEAVAIKNRLEHPWYEQPGDRTIRLHRDEFSTGRYLDVQLGRHSVRFQFTHDGKLRFIPPADADCTVNGHDYLPLNLDSGRYREAYAEDGKFRFVIA